MTRNGRFPALARALALGALAFLLSAQPVLAGPILWASDSGIGSASTIYQLNPANGAVQSSFAGPGPFSDGLVVSNNGLSLYIADSSPPGFSTIYQTSLTGTVLNQFNLTGVDAEGIEQLGNGNLAVSDGGGGRILIVNPTNGTVLSQFNTVAGTFGLAYDSVNDRLFGLQIAGVIDTYNPNTGAVIGGPLATQVGGVTLGLAFTGSSFFIAATGSTISEVNLAGNIINSFAGPGPFTEGLDYTTDTTPIPEPGSLALLAGMGCTLLAGRCFRRKGRVA